MAGPAVSFKIFIFVQRSVTVDRFNFEHPHCLYARVMHNAGTGNLIRHIPVETPKDYRNKKVKNLIKSAVDFAIKDMDKPTKSIGETISKIEKKDTK